jgi:methionyl-tRNA formyltransferase
MGTPPSAVPSLRRCVEDGHDVVAVWTQPDKPAGRGDKLRMPAVKEFALRHGLKVEQPAKIKTEESKALFASYDADVALVVAYGRILPTEYLKAPKRGCINVHFSLLPLYRGAAPTNWAIVNGEKYTGVTTMFIKEELDSGPILLQRSTPINEKETAPELMTRLAELGSDLLGETLSQLRDITPRPQHDVDATLAPMLTKQDGLIDWSRDAKEIERCIRGFQPWPNAFTHYKGHRLVVWSAEPMFTDSDAPSGEILHAEASNLLIKCGAKSALRLVELQAESKRRMSALDFLNGHRLKVGDRLG